MCSPDRHSRPGTNPRAPKKMTAKYDFSSVDLSLGFQSDLGRPVLPLKNISLSPSGNAEAALTAYTRCPLAGAKQTSSRKAATSEIDPTATLAVHCGNGFDAVSASIKVPV
jgi:hypothetical protein